MTQNFSKPMQKQWIDFYLERIQGLCLEKIDNGGDYQTHAMLDLIKDAISYIESKEAQGSSKRREDLESLKLSLKNLDHSGVS